MRGTATGFAATIVVALLSFPASNAFVSAAGDVSAPNVVKQTNDVRSKNGLGRLTIDPLLMKAAQAKAEDMAARGYFAHQAPDGRMPWDWITSVGYEFVAAAENLAVGYPSDVDLISAWMESEGHRHNLLNQKYTDIGIGIARGKYKGQDTIFVVQMFGKPRFVLAAPTLRATSIPVELQDSPALALAAMDIAFAPVPLGALPLAADALPVAMADLPTVALEAEPLPVESPALPAPVLPSTDIPFEPAPLPAVALLATAIPFSPSMLPATAPQANLAS
jgi:uncharacterized protein YkwD